MLDLTLQPYWDDINKILMVWVSTLFLMSDLGDFITEAFIASSIADNQNCPHFQSVKEQLP